MTYLPEDYKPNKSFIDVVYQAVVDMEQEGVEVIIPSKVQKRTKLGKTSVRVHLTKLVKEGYMTCRYAKVIVGDTTTITGVYKTTKKKKNT